MINSGGTIITDMLRGQARLRIDATKSVRAFLSLIQELRASHSLNLISVTSLPGDRIEITVETYSRRLGEALSDLCSVRSARMIEAESEPTPVYELSI